METTADTVKTRVALAKLDLALRWSSVRQCFGYGSGLRRRSRTRKRRIHETKDVLAELLGIVID
ncbi:hypothetical protein PHISCL_09483 [Aspergillus sclerotialis]|uniref:Uncharacterized protein n=1 Tax=Aspergillus sclerotialis TaxID=2070753 RepID=A0A3A2Z678_9EURO|nr:hypothetical protein PHISCL_09483 [Aspergillus sclerotialis]